MNKLLTWSSHREKEPGPARWFQAKTQNLNIHPQILFTLHIMSSACKVEKTFT